MKIFSTGVYIILLIILIKLSKKLSLKINYHIFTLKSEIILTFKLGRNREYAR